MAHVLKQAHRSVKGYDEYTNSSSTGPEVIKIIKNGENMGAAERKKFDFPVEYLYLV